MNFVYFYRHDLCAWAIHLIYFFSDQDISGHFPSWLPKKLVGTITYEPLIELHSKLVWLFSRYFWWSGTFGMNQLETKWLPQPFKKNWHGCSVGHFFSLFSYIDGQSLWLRGPAINWWLFFVKPFQYVQWVYFRMCVKSAKCMMGIEHII